MTATLAFHFDVTIPAGTPKATPLVTLTQVQDCIVERIEWTFPPGCQGNVGIQFGARSVAIIPRPSTTFITRSGNSGGYRVDGMHDTGDWSVIGYNTGSFPHTIQVTYLARKREPEEPDLILLPNDDVSELV